MWIGPVRLQGFNISKPDAIITITPWEGIPATSVTEGNRDFSALGVSGDLPLQLHGRICNAICVGNNNTLEIDLIHASQKNKGQAIIDGPTREKNHLL